MPEPASFDSRRPRPIKISNQGCCYSDARVASIAKKPVEQLGWDDYRVLFDIARCVGQYSELVYFLPFALDYLARQPDDSIECQHQIVNFCSVEAPSLERDGLLEECRSALTRCFDRWTGSFEVIHFDRSKSAEKGWGLPYFDMVKHSDVVADFIEELVRRRAHADLAVRLIASLAESGDPVKSAWLLEYARQARDHYSTFHDPNYRGDTRDSVDALMTPSKSTSIRTLVQDSALLRKHYQSIKDSLVKRAKSPTYWGDACVLLGIDG